MMAICGWGASFFQDVGLLLCDVAAMFGDRLVYFDFCADQIAKVAQAGFDGIVVTRWNGRVTSVVKPRDVCYIIIVVVIIAAGKDLM